MCQEKFRCPVPFFFAENVDPAKSGIKGSADPQYVTALDRVISDQSTEVQLIHAKSGGEGTHGCEQLADSIQTSGSVAVGDGQLPPSVPKELFH